MSAPLRDDSLDTVTPGGHPAPPGVRGDAEDGRAAGETLAEPGAARPLDAAPAPRSRRGAARVRGGRGGRRQLRTDERAGRRRRHLGRALDAVLGRVARTAVHVARRRRRLHRRRHRCDDLVAQTTRTRGGRTPRGRRRRHPDPRLLGEGGICEAATRSGKRHPAPFVVLVPQRTRRDRDRRVRPARPARGDPRTHACRACCGHLRRVCGRRSHRSRVASCSASTTSPTSWPVRSSAWRGWSPVCRRSAPASLMPWSASPTISRSPTSTGSSATSGQAVSTPTRCSPSSRRMSRASRTRPSTSFAAGRRASIRSSP